MFWHHNKTSQGSEGKIFRPHNHKMKQQKEYYWNEAVRYYQKKYLGLALLFCSGEKIINKALEIQGFNQQEINSYKLTQ